MIALARPAIAVFFALHGIAHVLGFLGSWRLAEFKDVPYTTLILNGSLEVGDVGMRLVGLLWLAGAAAFIAAAIAVLRGSWRVVGGLTVFSLAVCIAGLPTAIIGVWIDVAILIVLSGLMVARLNVLRPAHR